MIWSVHLRERDCPLLFTNGKSASNLATLNELGLAEQRLVYRCIESRVNLGDAACSPPMES